MFGGIQITPARIRRALLDKTPLGRLLVGQKTKEEMGVRVTSASVDSPIPSYECPFVEPAAYHPIFVQEEFERIAPVLGSDEDREYVFGRVTKYHHGARFTSRRMDVVVLEGAEVSFPRGAVLLNGRIVDEATIAIGSFLIPSIYQEVFSGPVVDLPGEYGMLPIQYWTAYGHWTTDVLPRLEALRASPMPAGVKLLMPEGLRGFNRAMLKAAGVREEDCVFKPNARYRVEELWLPTRGCEYSNIHPRCIRWLRSEVLPRVEVGERKRRIYISREDVPFRRVVNEADIFAQLKPLGFEKLVNTQHGWEDQARIFAESEVVIGPHGTNMANSIYSAPGTVVIEMFSPTHIEGSWSLVSKIVGSQYGAVMGREVGKGVNAHLWVDPAKVLQALKMAGIS